MSLNAAETREIEASTEYARQCNERHIESMKLSASFGQLALKLSFIANGGAVVSVLAFIGSVSSKSGDSDLDVEIFVLPFMIYAFGLTFVLISLVSSYFNYAALSSTRTEPWQLAEAIFNGPPFNWPHDQSQHRVIDISYWIAIVTGIFAGYFFLLQASFLLAS